MLRYTYIACLVRLCDGFSRSRDVGIPEDGGSTVYPRVGTSVLYHMVSQPTGPKHFYCLSVLFEFCGSAN